VGGEEALLESGEEALLEGGFSDERPQSRCPSKEA
jgi:hypothetical protein